MVGQENRRRSFIKAIRKKRIDSQIYKYYYLERDHGFYDNLHQYSKNKIHCSCPMCSAKTKNKGRRKKNWWAPPRNYKISDLKKIQRMDNSELEDME